MRAMLALLASLLLFPACDGDSTPTTPTAPDGGDEPLVGADVNEYLRSLPSWAEYAELKDEEEIVPGAPAFYEQEGDLVCSVTEASITRNPEDIVTFSPDSEILWLGSMIQGRGHRDGLGSLLELPVRQRGPLSVSIDILFSDNTRVVPDPDLASVTQAIGELIDAAEAAGHTAGSSIFFNQTQSHSLEQSALKLGLSVRYMGSSVKSSLETDRTAETSSLTATFTQKMFTTSMVLPQNPGTMFSPAFTDVLLQDQIDRGNIGSQNLPVFVGSMTWGRMLVVTMTSSRSVAEMKAALKASASYAGVSVSGEFSSAHKEVMDESELNVVAIGGHAQAVIDLIRTGQLGAYFQEDAPLTSARPISYVLRNLGDNTIAKVSETTEYDIRECQPGGVERFTDYTAWRNALGTEYQEFALPTSAANLALADELDTPPGGNAPVGPRMTFSGVNTGFPIDFYLEATNAPDLTDPSAQAWTLVFRDQEFWGGADRYISIGDVDGISLFEAFGSVSGAFRSVMENDDFDIVIIRDGSTASGQAVYAIGFWVADNTAQAGESLTLRGDGFEVKFTDNLNGFMGFISPFPITSIHFDEDGGGDDIAIRDFHFGVAGESGDGVGGGFGS